jgi:phosphoglucosamine mutase
MTRKYFGTDGVRGRVGEFPITPDFVLKLGWAAGRVLANDGARKIVIGKDTRISGYLFESALLAGITAAGVDVRLLGPMPTPAVAYLTRTFQANAGIVISASHNSYTDNGIKFFGPDGRKLLDETESRIEALLDGEIRMVGTDQLGKVKRINDARGRYIEFCKSTVPGLSLAGLTIVVDCAHGASYHIAPDIFEELGAAVIAIGNQPDGININQQCGSTHPEALIETVKQNRAALGIAFDGDADRVLMVDHRGELVDGDQLLFILARDRQERGVLQGGVVGTLMTNFGLEQALGTMQIPFARAKVGDRYVMELLDQKQWLLGGEASGHLICLDHNSTGDGAISALQVLAALVRRSESLADAVAAMKKMPQVMINVRGSKCGQIFSLPGIKEAIAEAEAHLVGQGRVLLRPSGTEPVVRVMVEGADHAVIDPLCQQLASKVEAALRQA